MLQLLLMARNIILPVLIALSSGLIPSSAMASDPWVVSVGDSAISGEGARWAGNSNKSPDLTDALGPTAYFDNQDASAELIPDCHRVRSAAVHIGESFARSKNLACSGAFTHTVLKDRNGQFKPGLDFYQGPKGEGQLRLLEDFARTHRVKMVVVSIGGNDFEFGPVSIACVTSYLSNLLIKNKGCRNDKAVTRNFTPENVAARTDDIREAYLRVAGAMKAAGYSKHQYSIIALDYPALMPAPKKMKYPDGTLARQSVGGCGWGNQDLEWARVNAFPVITRAIDSAAAESGLHNLRRLKLSHQLKGHRLCETGTSLVEENPGSWREEGASDQAEWVNHIRTASTVFGPYQVNEGFHPNYWAHLALRGCLRQAFRALSVKDSPRSGYCLQKEKGLNARGEPRMKLAEQPN